jgi:DNA-binding NtrC family response regulator
MDIDGERRGPAPTILIVEGDPALLTLWSETMANAGYEVTTALSFEEARRSMVTSVPDVLLTDIRLGAYNGLQLVIRARAANPRLRAIVVTGHPDVVVQREAERLGAVHVEKPLDMKVLLELVAGALGGHKPAM